MTATARLDTIETRANAATDGPWGHLFEPSDSARWVDSPHRLSVATVPAEGDATFIAAARTDVPALVAALRAVLDLCDRGESLAEELLLMDLSASEWGAAHAMRNTYRAVLAAITAALAEVSA